MKMNETDIKYFAGLLDADGCVSLRFITSKGVRRVSVGLSLSQRESHAAPVLQLCELFNVTPHYRDGKVEFSAARKTKLLAFADRVCKYMVVKGSLLRFAVDSAYQRESSTVSPEEEQSLRKEFTERRRIGGPVKSIKHVSSSWAAGFLDGDGNYSMRLRKTKNGRSDDLCVRVGLTKTEKVLALQKLADRFGGVLHKERDKRGYFNWRLSLGKGNKKLAVSFLKDMRKRSKVKREKIEKLLHYHTRAAQTELEGPHCGKLQSSTQKGVVSKTKKVHNLCPASCPC